MPLHGHEISPSIDPIEAGFKWACDFTKDFIGKQALEAIVAAGPARRLVGLDVTGGVPREGFEVLTPEGSVRRALRRGHVLPHGEEIRRQRLRPRRDLAKPGTRLAVSIRDKSRDAVVVKRPLYVPAYRK